MLPKRIGRYEVLGQLAAGGMAEILLARLKGAAGFERAVVIKRVLRAFAGSDAFVRMFLDEARIVASLMHPNVVHVQELGEHEGEAFLVMEYVAGENLASLVKRSVAAGENLDPRLAAHIVAEACAGLHAAHELTGDDGRPQNLVHRDVSPQNVLVAYDGHVKLVDFGVALVEERSTRTEPGEVKGKFDYMSPEQMLGKPLDRRSDLFSLGTVLYELAVGRRLFKRNSHAKTIEAICREPIVPPSRMQPDFPKSLEAVILRALAKNAEERYATAAEMRRELLEIARELANPVETLSDRMRRLFPDRIVEKEEMLRKAKAGDELSHVPQSEIEETVLVPDAPEATVFDPHLVPQPPMPPAPIAETVPRVSRAAIAVAAGSLGLLVGVGVLGAALVVRRDQRQETLALVGAPSASVRAIASGASAEEPPPPSPSSTVTIIASEPAPAASEVVLHVETKPNGARVLVAGKDRGETPLELRLPRGTAGIPIEVHRQGYAAATQRVVPDVDQRILVALSPQARGRYTRATTKPAGGATSAPAPPASTGFRRFD